MSSNSSSGRTLLLAGMATVSALVTGYLAYGYATSWKGPAYSFWCPEKRQRTLKSPFFGKVDQESSSRETEARAWMEHYVRSNLVSKHAKRKNRTGIVEEKIAKSPRGS